jgi:CRP-like cAMP-binding protein
MRLYKTLEGHELTLDVIEVGSMFGEASLVGRPQWAHCQALEPSKVALLGVNTFRHLVVRNPEVGLKATQLFVERLYDYESKLADIGLKEVLGRLASLILHMLEREGIVTSEDLRIPRHYTHEELAAMIEAKRVAVTRAFGRLRHAGAVKHDRRGIRIKNRNTLERFAKAV